MMPSELKINIQPQWGSRMVNVWVHDIRATHIVNISYESNQLKFTPVNEMGDAFDENGKQLVLHPFLSIPEYFALPLFKAIAEYNNEKGIKTRDQNLIEGTLVATEKHLQDMQKIVTKLLKV